MKTKFWALCAIATALVFVGCQKEKEVTLNTSSKTHSVVFTAEKAGETRTAIASEDGVVSYKWISGDQERMHIYETTGEGEEKLVTEGTIDQMTLESDGKIATFYVTFEGDAPSGPITYSATYGGTVSNKHNPLIPEEQNPGVDTFDPVADALVADEIVKQTRDESPSFKFTMNRVASINKMTLKGLPAGEKVESVLFESDKYHSGYVAASGLSSSGKKLLMKYNANNTIPSNGEFPVYFVTAPVVDATFTVTVKTDQKRFVKTSTKKISFALGQVRRFGVDLTGCEASEGRTFTLVEKVSDLVLGSDIVIAANGSKDIAMSIAQNNNNRGTTEAKKSADYKTLTITEQVQVFTLKQGTTSGTYAFLCVNGNNSGYIYAAGGSSSNYLRTQSSLDANGSWEISLSSNEATITSQGENAKILRYNSTNNIFSAYGSGQQSVFLYQAAALPDPGMSWSAETATATISSTGTTFDPPTLTLGHASSVTYSSSVPAVATISGEGVVEILAKGTTTISANFAGNSEYAPATASYVLTVTDTREKAAAPTFTPAAGMVEEGTVVTISSATEGATIYYTLDGTTPTTASTQGTTVTIDAAKTINAIAVKEGFFNSDVATASYTIIPAASTIATILADDTITSSNTKQYVVAGATVMAAQGGKNYVIGDATGVMLVYYEGALTVGNQYNIQGDVKLYNGVHEFNKPTVQTGSGTAPSYGTPEEMTIATLTAYASAPVTKYAKVHVTAPSSGYVCSDGTNSVNVYDGTGTLSSYYGKPIVVTGYLIGYNTYQNKNQINILATSIEQDVVSFLTVTPETLTWAAGDYGSSVAKTITVTIDDDASGYSVSASSNDWTVSDDEEGTITVYPKAANTSTSADKSLTLTITHNDDASISKTVTCTQSKVVSGTTEEITGAFTLDSNGNLVLTTASGITITQAKGTSSNAPNSSYATATTLRIYDGNTLTFSGKTFTKIEFTHTSGNNGGANTSSNVGTYTRGTTSSTWEGEATSVTITNTKASGASNIQLRPTKIVVTYK